MALKNGSTRPGPESESDSTRNTQTPGPPSNMAEREGSPEEDPEGRPRENRGDDLMRRARQVIADLMELTPPEDRLRVLAKLDQDLEKA